MMNNEQVRAAPEMVDLMGVKSNGETVLLGKVAMPPRMKAKELIRELIGGDFEDESSDAAMWLYAFERFIEFMESQRPALATSAAPERSGKLAGKTAKQQFDELMGDGAEPSALERLRFFCSLAMDGQDWLDAESLFDDLAAPISEATPPKADSSSAAPSEASPVNTIEYWAGAYETGFGGGHGMIVHLLREYAALRKSRAAPAPTGESLNAGAIQKLAQDAGFILNPVGELVVPAPDSDATPYLRKMLAALATPRQTEDGGLSAAIPSWKDRARYDKVEIVDSASAAPYMAAEIADLRNRLASTLAPKKPAAQGGVPEVVLAWAVERWNAEVSQRPLVNVHRRSLDDTWRQVIRYAGGDPDALVGPSHDDLLAAPTGDHHGE